MSALWLLGELRRRGVRVWVEEGRLELDAPEGALHVLILDQLRRVKAELLELVESEPSGPPQPLRGLQFHTSGTLAGLWTRTIGGAAWIVPTKGTLPAFQNYLAQKKSVKIPLEKTTHGNHN
jgi:hypothetical protein